MNGRYLLVLVVSALAIVSGCGGQSFPEASASNSTASSDVATLGSGDVVLDAGTYRIDAPPYPPFEITVPGGWRALDGWAVYRFEADHVALRAVEIGRRNGVQAQVVRGLERGDQ